MVPSRRFSRWTISTIRLTGVSPEFPVVAGGSKTLLPMVVAACPLRFSNSAWTSGLWPRGMVAGWGVLSPPPEEGETTAVAAFGIAAMDELALVCSWRRWSKCWLRAIWLLKFLSVATATTAAAVAAFIGVDWRKFLTISASPLSLPLDPDEVVETGLWPV